MKKLALKTLAITLSITNLLNFVPIKINAAEQTIPAKTINTNLNKNPKPKSNEEESKAKKYLKTVLKAAGIGVAVYTGTKLMFIGGLTAMTHFKINETKNEYLEKFKGHIEPNKLTKRQEGIGWCWLACLQALLKIKGIEKTQKELYKEITDKSPGWFEVTRPNGLLVREPLLVLDYYTSYMMSLSVSCDSISKYINEKTNFVFKNKTISVNKCSLDDICTAIKDIYKNESKGPFAILDSLCCDKSGNLAIAHYVNVVEIREDNITIECPTTELRRTENIKDFVKRYTENNIFKNFGVHLSYIAPKSNI